MLKETGFKTLAKRRDSHKMMIFCKCAHGKLPLFLTTECMPKQSRNTRAASSVTFRIPKCKTSAFKQSFFPSCSKVYNTHETNFRSATLDKQIAHYKKETKTLSNNYYTLNRRFVQITLAQIRIQFSNLNTHLFTKGCVNSPECACAERPETPLHYFLKCNLYDLPRQLMLQTLVKYAPNDSDSTLLHLILQGNGNYFENVEIISAVSEFLNSTGRFKY